MRNKQDLLFVFCLNHGLKKVVQSYKTQIKN